MADRNNKIIHNDDVGSDNNCNDSFGSLSFVRRIRVVCQTFLKFLKRFTIPFTAVSSSYLFANVNSAYASSTRWQTILERGSVRNGYFSTKAIQERGGGLQEFKEFIGKWDTILDSINNGIHWVNHLPENIAQLSVNLLTKVYELLMLVLHTPLFIFNNSYLTDTTLVFSTCSILIVTFLTLFELIKKMIKKTHTDFIDIVKRWSIAVVGSGFAPFLFQQTFNLINLISKAITKIGVTEINSEGVMNYLKLSGFNTAMLIGFDVIILALMIPILLQNGRRFFDLMCLAAITPLALTAWVFDDYRYLFTKWWNHIKMLGGVQLIYSTFVCLLGIFIFGTRNIVSGGAFFLKMIIVFGGLWRMANPPQIVKSKIDNGTDVIGMGDGLFKTFKNVRDTLTLRNLKPTKLLKEKSEKEASKILKLRKKHGRRYVNDLL